MTQLNSDRKRLDRLEDTAIALDFGNNSNEPLILEYNPVVGEGVDGYGKLNKVFNKVFEDMGYG